MNRFLTHIGVVVFVAVFASVASGRGFAINATYSIHADGKTTKKTVKLPTQLEFNDQHKRIVATFDLSQVQKDFSKILVALESFSAGDTTINDSSLTANKKGAAVASIDFQVDDATATLNLIVSLVGNKERLGPDIVIGVPKEAVGEENAQEEEDTDVKKIQTMFLKLDGNKLFTFKVTDPNFDKIVKRNFLRPRKQVFENSKNGLLLKMTYDTDTAGTYRILRAVGQRD